MYCTCTDHCNMLAYGKRSALHDNIKNYKDSNLGETAQSKFSKDMKNAWISFSYKSCATATFIVAYIGLVPKNGSQGHS